MAFSRAKTWTERGLQAQAMKDKCNEIIERLGLRKTDARALGMVHVRQMCNTLAMVPIKLQQNAELPENVRFILGLLGLSGPEALSQVLKGLNRNSKLSFVTMVQFALENCIQQILDAIPGEGRRGSFSAAAHRLIQVAGVTPADDKLELLLVPAWIRNALHSNGIHHRKSKTVDVDGEPYVFTQNKRLSCGSWSHIFHGVLTALPVYEEMFVSKAVSSIAYIEAL